VSSASSKNIQIVTTKEEYEKNHHKKRPPIKVICHCGKEHNTNTYNLLNNKGCRSCWEGFKKKKMSVDEMSRLAALVGLRLKIEEHRRSKDKISFICEKHGEIKTMMNSIQQGHGCSKCQHLVSSQEIEILDYVKSKTSLEILCNNREVLSGKELDIWIPGANFGIEFDGLYWHSEKKDTDAKGRAKRKYAAIKKAGIKILVIYADEWKNPIKNAILRSMIDHRLGVTSSKVYARDTKLVDIDNKIAKDFMSLNHLEGSAKFKKAIGLIDENGELLMCSTFRSSRGKILELARMATKVGHSVVGGASKMLSSIKEPLMSYSDNRLSSGEVYISSGFKEITQTTEPSYWYTDLKKRVFRTQCQKRADLPGTEREQALAGAFSDKFGHSRPVYRIYGFGQRKWIKTN
jgi:hypothetical protein